MDPFGAFDHEDQDIIDTLKDCHPTYLATMCEELAKLPRVTRIVVQRVSDYKGFVAEID